MPLGVNNVLTQSVQEAMIHNACYADHYYQQLLFPTSNSRDEAFLKRLALGCAGELNGGEVKGATVTESTKFLTLLRVHEAGMLA